MLFSTSKRPSLNPVFFLSFKLNTRDLTFNCAGQLCQIIEILQIGNLSHQPGSCTLGWSA